MRERRGPRFHKMGKSKKSPIVYSRFEVDAWMAQHVVPTKDMDPPK